MTEHSKSNIIKIENENDAWEIFRQALEGDFDDLSDIELEFSNWPQIDINLKGPKHKSSLTAKNMEGLVELQNTIYRTYALAAHNKLNANKLTGREKERLTITFRISKGSSEIEAELKKSLSIFAKDMASKMKPKHYIITILGLGLIWGSPAVLNTYLQHQKDLFISEQQTIQKKLDIDDRKFASEQELRRMELLASAYEHNPQLEQVQESVDAMHADLFKKFSDADKISILGTEHIKSETVKKIFTKKRVRAIEDRLDGIFRIIKVDSSSIDHFKVKVRNIADGVELTVTVKNTEIVDRKKKKCLQNAEWSKEPVLMRMNIKRLRGAIVSATILNVEKAPEKVINLINDGITDIKINWSHKKGFKYETPKKKKS
jgi:hypothetical protein